MEQIVEKIFSGELNVNICANQTNQNKIYSDFQSKFLLPHTKYDIICFPV